VLGQRSGETDRQFVSPLGEDVPHDGATPITWYVAANVLVVRDGRMLMVRQPPQWGGRWELPGGGVELIGHGVEPGRLRQLDAARGPGK
jgi:hypothetical protein